MRRLFSLTAATLLALAGPLAAAARKPAPPAQIRGPVLVTVSVGESAAATMPFALWRKLAVEYVGGRAVGVDEGTASADDLRCRNARARYAVLATFERATRLPGLAQETDRAYAIGRFTVRDCATGALRASKTIGLESDPLTQSDRTGPERDPERLWARSVRAALARNPLLLTTPPQK